MPDYHEIDCFDISMCDIQDSEIFSQHARIDFVRIESLIVSLQQLSDDEQSEIAEILNKRITNPHIG